MLKNVAIKLIKLCPVFLRGRIYIVLWKIRKFSYKLQIIHPVRLIAICFKRNCTGRLPIGIKSYTGEIVHAADQIDSNWQSGNEHGRFILSEAMKNLSVPVRLIELDGARVYGEQGAVIDKDAYLVSDVSREIGRAMGGKTAWAHSIFTKFSLGPIRKINGHVGLICVPSSNTYFHWLFDVLPRIYFLRDSEVNCYLVGKYSAAYQKQSINMLGLSSPVLQIGEEQVQVDKLSCLTSINRDSFMLQTIQFLRDRFIAPGEARRSRRLFISRESANYRKLTHYKEIQRVLEKWGIEEFVAEEHSFHEQIEAFQDAQLIVAPHGSGLANIVFCREHATVIELFSSEYTNPLFCRLAKKCNLNYDCAIDRDDYRAKNHYENIIADICVTPEQVDALLKKWDNDSTSL